MLATQILFICLEAVESLIEIIKKFKNLQNSVAISSNVWPFKLKCRGRFDSYGFGAVLYDNRKTQNVIRTVHFLHRQKALNCEDWPVEYKYVLADK